MPQARWWMLVPCTPAQIVQGRRCPSRPVPESAQPAPADFESLNCQAGVPHQMCRGSTVNIDIEYWMIYRPRSLAMRNLLCSVARCHYSLYSTGPAQAPHVTYEVAGLPVHVHMHRGAAGRFHLQGWPLLKGRGLRLLHSCMVAADLVLLVSFGPADANASQLPEVPCLSLHLCIIRIARYCLLHCFQGLHKSHVTQLQYRVPT